MIRPCRIQIVRWQHGLRVKRPWSLACSHNPSRFSQRAPSPVLTATHAQNGQCPLLTRLTLSFQPAPPSPPPSPPPPPLPSLPSTSLIARSPTARSLSTTPPPPPDPLPSCRPSPYPRPPPHRPPSPITPSTPSVPSSNPPPHHVSRVDRHAGCLRSSPALLAERQRWTLQLLDPSGSGLQRARTNFTVEFSTLTKDHARVPTTGVRERCEASRRRCAIPTPLHSRPARPRRRPRLLLRPANTPPTYPLI